MSTHTPEEDSELDIDIDIFFHVCLSKSEWTHFHIYQTQPTLGVVQGYKLVCVMEKYFKAKENVMT